jgi:hypothetical protein
MQLSRDRNRGTPRLVNFIKRLEDNAKKVGWNGLLIRVTPVFSPRLRYWLPASPHRIELGDGHGADDR